MEGEEKSPPVINKKRKNRNHPKRGVDNGGHIKILPSLRWGGKVGGNCVRNPTNIREEVTVRIVSNEKWIWLGRWNVR